MLIIRVHHNVNYNNIKVEHNIHKFNFNLNIIILILMSPHNDVVFFLFCGTVAVLVCLPKSHRLICVAGGQGWYFLRLYSSNGDILSLNTWSVRLESKTVSFRDSTLSHLKFGLK